LSLSNHFLVQISAKQVHLDQFNNYLVLRDDVIIGNESVAKQYTLNLKSIRLEVNDTKCIISNDSTLCAEFASKYFTNGSDLSPIPFAESGSLTTMLDQVSLTNVICQTFLSSVKINLYDKILFLKKFKRHKNIVLI
jgi:hypothetical protein